MPIYEYWCGNCRRKLDLFSATYTTEVPHCPECRKDSLQRLFSSFSTQKSYKDVYDSILSDTQMTKGLLHNDPQALVEWNKRMSGGEPVAPEYRETIERMEKGEMPSSGDSA
ncbi:MAG: zinc ribbon domain-containing protein [Dehalococcoidia bacterium]|nr:zinc ribbon domain-containing protein [Dehalococcoidia bacterium]MDD5493073.1 zinc ribbon domain-containing protein [Dehalococcoidia bacterium]